MNENIVLATIREQKASAKTHTSFGKHKDALEEMNKAIALLEQLGGDWLAAATEHHEAPAELAHRVEVAEEYSDALAMRGGILRRMGRDVDALKSYVAGSRFELDDRFQVMNSYSTVNALKMTLLGDTVLPDQHDVPTAEEAIDMIWSQLKGQRGQDRWAWADLGDCYLMKGNEATNALEAYRRFAELSTEDHLDSAHIVLSDLYDQLTELPGDPRAEAVKQVVDYLEAQLEPQ